MMREPRETLSLEDELYRIGWIFLAAGLAGVYAALRWALPVLSETECVFWRFFKIYCPGCGGTRAVIALLRGHFLLSLWYHPIVIYLVLCFGWFMLSHTLEKLRFPFVRGMRFHVWQLYGALAVIVGNCILKNFLHLAFGIVL